MANTSVEWKVGDVLVSTYFKGKDARFNRVVTYLGEGMDEDTFKGKTEEGDVFEDWLHDGFVLQQN